jgi:Icc-related predicted phosphoesterase
MIIDTISDLHGFYPELEGGDLLIVAGDWTFKKHEQDSKEFLEWIQAQKYKKIVFIAGNHDTWWEKHQIRWEVDETEKGKEQHIIYLCDSGTEFEGIKIWGSPWTKTFEGMNPKCKAFTFDSEEELEEKWALIPNDIDILITHSPPYDILDEVDSQQHCTSYHVGSRSLLKRVCEIKPKLHVFGHVHEGYGDIIAEWKNIPTAFVNASHVNEYYEPVNKPIRVIL